MGRHAAPSGHGMAVAGMLAGAGVAVAAALWRGTALDWTLAVPVVVLLVLVGSLVTPPQRWRGSMADGVVVAVIPAFNEDPEALHGTVWSLLAGTRVPDVIHVVDDGSDVPLPPLEHPRVVWHRTLNAGKRRAQATALRSHAGDVDYVLTVDSDCTVDRHAVARLLRAMSRPGVQAATGLPLARNMSSWLAAVVDLEIASICLTYRTARSRMGSLTTCSGALSMYRAAVVVDNLDDYSSDRRAAGDDRRLTQYAMLRGQVVSVPGAVVHTDMPATVPTLYRQRIRWSTSHWRYMLWEVANLPMTAASWTIYHVVLSIIVPAGIAWSLLLSPALGYGLAWQFLAYWTGICWLLNIRYAVGRPHMAAWRRWSIWLVGTPALVLLHLFVLKPAMLHALGHTRSTGWRTRQPVLEGATA